MSPVARYTQLLIPTLREAPVDAVSASHQLLVRAGFVRQVSAGLYSVLPLGWRSMRKLEQLLRHEMDALGAQEVLLPSLQPAEPWQASGRWDAIDETMFRLRDRRGNSYTLGMTAEELMTDLARTELRSYRQLPQRWYQISPKFRDEPRPRSGLLRVREFLMKDAYSFDLDQRGLDRAFEVMRAAYERIFATCELTAWAAEASSGAMGGRDSIEFLAPSEVGEDTAVHCRTCGYTANREVARGLARPIVDEASNPGAEEPVRFPTPGVRTIEALAAPPYGVPPERQLKTLVFIADAEPVVAVVRGDHQLSEAKLLTVLGASTLRAAQSDEIFELLGAQPGSLGAVNFRAARLIVDEVLPGRTNMVTGANRDDVHLRGVDVDRDILSGPTATVADLREVAAGEGCPRCAGLLEFCPALEVGHIFKLGTRYSSALGATVLNAEGTETPLLMGCYGIGLGRLLAAIVEQHHDADGIVWPVAVAPFAVTVLALGQDPAVTAAAETLTRQLAESGVDVLYDDRGERAGVKFKDADLVGIPWRIAVGPRGLAEGWVEWKHRSTEQSDRVSLDDIVSRTVMRSQSYHWPTTV
ncbi:MAG: proline--tRNA ligase [Chloroflexi bacterium]|nr:proline--tRNA ligase [Chloroflexota bacterium]